MMETWITTTKNELLKTETENINSRLLQWQTIVNECTKNEYISAFKTECTDLINLPPYTLKTTDTQMNKFLLLILNWNGLNMRRTALNKQPKTFKAYQHKSKNQINGSRAKHYSRALYPFMIDCAEQYANDISHMLFNDNNISDDNLETRSDYRNIQTQCATLFYDILMYSYLVQLCQCRLRVTKQGRRVYLLCDNSIIGHRSNITAQMLQKYAPNHPYIEQFPSHRQEAIDYFNQQKAETYQQLFILYQKRKTLEITNQNIKVNSVIQYGQNIVHLMGFMKQHCKSDNGQRVNIHKDTFNMLMSLVDTLEQKQNDNDEAINSLEEYYSVQLETSQQTQKSQQSQHSELTQDYNVSNNGCNGCNNNKVIIRNQLQCEQMNMNNNYGCQLPAYAPTYYENMNNLPLSAPKMTNFGSFGSMKSFNMSYIGQSSNRNYNNHSAQDITNDFECDSIIMNSAPMCAPMSIDNTLLYNTNINQHENKNDEYIQTQYDNFNDIQFNYDNLDISSQYNII